MSRSVAAYHHGDLRRALVRSGVDLLDSTAPAALSLRGVARAAGVSHAAPYHHFEDRQDLLRAVGDECMRDFVEAQRVAVEAQSDPYEKLIALGLAYVGFAQERPHAFALIFDATLCPPGNPSPVRAELIQANEDLLRRTAAVAHADKLAAGVDLEALSAALWGLVHGLAALVGEGHLPLDAVESALRSLG